MSTAAFDSLDYRRFDHLGSESDEEPQDQQFSPELLQSFQQMNSALNPTNESRRVAEHTARKFYPAGGIKIHPHDDSVPAWVYTDPDTWEAPRDPSKYHQVDAH